MIWDNKVWAIYYIAILTIKLDGHDIYGALVLK